VLLLSGDLPLIPAASSPIRLLAQSQFYLCLSIQPETRNPELETITSSLYKLLQAVFGFVPSADLLDFASIF